ncbi:MAG: hypothetical protein A3G38_03155 [Omnitrophica WOR_2 bacterium RIFCSPLOWO2_12_FULL_51_8]|nr:MAG: hypothetical protein A3G38_03155 [Omnitrophica WOR_2 bacterium RIFCSPLOWO2_12_FULL_51_8]
MEYEKARILIVDDEEEVVNSLRHFFTTKGYDVICTLSGEDALGIMEQEKVNLVILDMMLPGLKGAQVAKIIKTKFPSVKIIAVTAYPEEGKDLTKENILDGLFIKPVGINELYLKLTDVLGRGDVSILDTSVKQGIKVRALLLKAKLLFLEPTEAIYLYLSGHFKRLSEQGEYYELSAAKDIDDIAAQLKNAGFDLLLINQAYASRLDNTLIEKIYEAPNKAKESIVYNLSLSNISEGLELERLVKEVQSACLKYGLIDIKWLEI